jgi:hypothetical protein
MSKQIISEDDYKRMLAEEYRQTIAAYYEPGHGKRIEMVVSAECLKYDVKQDGCIIQSTSSLYRAVETYNGINIREEPC